MGIQTDGYKIMACLLGFSFLNCKIHLAYFKFPCEHIVHGAGITRSNPMYSGVGLSIIYVFHEHKHASSATNNIVMKMPWGVRGLIN